MSKFELYTRLCYVAVAVCVVLLVFDAFGPRPKPKRNVNRATADIAKVEKQTQASLALQKELRVSNAENIWPLPADEVGPLAMNKAEAVAKQHNLVVTAFRPGKPESEGSLERLTYQVILEGPFPKVVAFVRAMETPGTKIAVSSIQLTSSDGATDAVTATVGLLAYRQETDKPSKP